MTTFSCRSGWRSGLAGTPIGRRACRSSSVTTMPTWRRGAIVCNDPHPANPNETTAVQLADGRVMLNIRHEGPQHFRAISTSENGESDWSPLRYDRFAGTHLRSQPRPFDCPADEHADASLFANPGNPNGSGSAKT